MNITAEQLEHIRAWAAQGTDLNTIQKKLIENGCSIRFMDLRFLLLDHGIEIAQPCPVKEESAEEQDSSKEAEAATTLPEGKSIEISCNELQIPGTIISGKANFRSGAQGAWQFDLQGNFSWSQMHGQPQETELREFQIELNNLLRKMA